MLMALIMIRVRSSNDPRAGIQNGFWGIKYLIIIASMVGAFFIPNGEFGNVTSYYHINWELDNVKKKRWNWPTLNISKFEFSEDVWMYFGIIGAFLFILIQLVLIIDFAHSWAEAWVGNYEEDDNRGWLGALLGVTGEFFGPKALILIVWMLPQISQRIDFVSSLLAVLYGICIAAVVLFYIYFTGDYTGQCPVHEFFISFNLILCVGISITSILPVVQEHMPKSGLLQSGVISLYIIYLTWSAMGNSPYLVRLSQLSLDFLL